MKHVELFGFAGSTYVRTARLVCAEKHVDHQLLPLAFRQDAHRELHPFLRMPVMRIGKLVLYETLAIATYIDEAFDGPRLMPAGATARAQVLQWISTCSDYIYRDLVQALLKSEDPSEEELARARSDLEVIDAQLRAGPFLLGSEIFLCDLFLAPMVAFAGSGKSAPHLLQGLQGLQTWFERIASRRSFEETAA
jgi:glutathione S-transferase